MQQQILTWALKGQFHASVFIALMVIAAVAATMVVISASSPVLAQERTESSMMYPEIVSFLEQRRAEFDQIGGDRRVVLDKLAAYVKKSSATEGNAGGGGGGGGARLVFVCTHNSRRSHLSQIWAAAAAHAHGIKITSYSGGTETTAFNPRAVAAARRAGFRVEKTTDDENPIYHVRFGDTQPALTCFSKVHDNAPNPKRDFAVIMVCDQADTACPIVPGAAERFSLPFVDPKAKDNTPDEAAAYDERSAQIARELLYVMERASK